MKRRLFFTLALFLVAAIFFIAPIQADETKENQETTTEKSFRVEEPNLKLGKIMAGKDAVGTFIFHNETDKDVKIIRAKPS